jgi:hypothetical protein
MQHQRSTDAAPTQHRVLSTQHRKTVKRSIMQHPMQHLTQHNAAQCNTQSLNYYIMQHNPPFNVALCNTTQHRVVYARPKSLEISFPIS